jgi:DNA polymerase III subunit delta'
MYDIKQYKWIFPVWETLLAKPDVLHHALLLAGPSGVGKSVFAEALATRLLCERAAAPAAFACGECDGCRWFGAGNHPDYRNVGLATGDEPEDENGDRGRASGGKKTVGATSAHIRIDQIRELEQFVFVGSHRNGNRVIVIDPADCMNPSAANSVLKLLEEPPVNTYFILVSSKWRTLLPTLRSRCRQVLFTLPAEETAVAWLDRQGVSDSKSKLSLVGGAPLKVPLTSVGAQQDVVEAVLGPFSATALDPLRIAAEWDGVLKDNAGLTLEGLIDTLQKWIYDLTRVKWGADPKYLVTRTSLLSTWANKTDVAKLARCYADLLRIRRVVSHPLNTLLFLEDVATRCATAVAAPRLS